MRAAVSRLDPGIAGPDDVGSGRRGVSPVQRLPSRHNGWMGKGKRNRQKRKRYSSGLSDHQRDRKTLTPPLLQLPNLKQTSWPQDSMPDFLWLASLDRDLPPKAIHEALDVLDEFMPTVPDETEAETMEDAGASARDVDADSQITADAGDGSGDEDAGLHPVDFLDGRLSTLALLPEERRADARAALRERAPWALPDQLGHALALYPECPAGWLYEDWSQDHAADPEIGLPYLKGLVGPIIPSRVVASTRLRLLALSRWGKHGRLSISNDLELVNLLPRYPSQLDEDDQRKVEGFARAGWNALAPETPSPLADGWIEYFWRQSWEISACDPESDIRSFEDEEEEVEEEERGGVETGEEAGEEAVESEREQPTIPELRDAFTEAVRALGAELRQRQQRARLTLYDPTADEVKFGLASRLFRLLLRLVENPRLWRVDLAPHVFRSLIDARILTAWLLKRDDAAFFQSYKDYGLGKRKLYKLHLEELMDSEGFEEDEDIRRLHKRLEAEVNVDRLEEFQKIDIGGNFAGISIHEMAKEVRLKSLYDLQYQPLSTEAHGEWGSLMAHDLRHCGNPLHRYHRLGAFDTTPDRMLDLMWVLQAFNLASDGIEEVFESYGLDISDALKQCAQRMTGAVRAERQTA